ncbi:NAD(P)/FAD-dependent oxidoreductase [Dasania sp. GY-MA-18]|uniref:NAD(P)/FAD-dependent oxidoreductase n=1 Tax=Dasania phycosphaerae TaxID=2950436 RepID=A0A9J6RMN9_9GAMM|nr:MULTISPECIES: NAD(P)/FAD-dependent oxidoreductase [Dasania]MCR8923153.1 NAD(P)/FAD-dependent oxidoreductase [Dasania sp. GY-MA-18]MCZ0865585.1 NAD(P)/FAD-dependent oxidoreductase [Dasania phycosphaerae]MCZ0869310.1 NAD(P)/FAD-dependent oxidoreductase [Dasania phycosphaerae]
MTVEKTDTLVVGGGQAGVAMSEHLSKLDVPHIVLERNRIAEKWRTGRWDSLVANGPAWHDRFPGLDFDDVDPDAFAPKDRIADYFEAYAKKFNAPIRTGVEVKKVERNVGKPGFTIETSEGVIEANRVVAATGPFQRPVIPPIAPQYDNIQQIHSADYYNPEQLPAGNVMVIGAGSSGVQIADELQRAGKKVYLSVGPHDRPPRAYRGRDFCWWLGVLGEWDAEAMKPGTEHVTIAVSGAHGGKTVDFRELAHQGITLLGMTKSFDNTRVTLQPDLVENIANGDKNYLELLDAADAYIERNGLDLPEEPEARKMLADPDCLSNPLLELDLAEAGVTSIIWATGYAVDYSWLKVNAFDEQGKPKHQRGVSSEPGVYFVGLPWLSRRGSTFIWGVWHDAKHIAGHIATQLTYSNYKDPSQR